jgi:hypothetical protein
MHHGLIKYKDTETKWRHLKILTCKGTLRQVFLRVYRLEIPSFVNYCPSNLLSGSLSQGLGQINTCCKVRLLVNCLDDDIFALSSMILIFSHLFSTMGRASLMRENAPSLPKRETSKPRFTHSWVPSQHPSTQWNLRGGR